MSKKQDQVHKDLLATDSKIRTDDEHIRERDKHALHDERGKLAELDKKREPSGPADPDKRG